LDFVLSLTSHFSDPNLRFVAAPPLAPATAEVDLDLVQRYEDELKIAEAAPLPEENDDL